MDTVKRIDTVVSICLVLFFCVLSINFAFLYPHVAIFGDVVIGVHLRFLRRHFYQQVQIN